jgi:hypothetical protein
MAGLSVLGFGSLCFLFGAAVMFFRLPVYEFLDNAFAGAQAWHERGRSTIPSRPPGAVVRSEEQGNISVDQANKTWDGYTLCTTTQGSRATLLDMRGREVYRWELPFRKAWPRGAPHVRRPLPDDQIHWFRCYLYPNGDLLAVYHADGDTPYGYGLVKLNKDSQLLWTYDNYVHHDLDVGEEGTIYTLAQKILNQPPPGLEGLPVPYLAESLVVLTPEGRELESIPLLEAFSNSPYALDLLSSHNFSTLTSLTTPDVTPPLGKPPHSAMKGDLLHPNSVKVLSEALAEKFPLFKAGQVLLSIRNVNTLAVVDPATRRVAWAGRGIWRIQHDAEFLDNGHLLIYDNLGLMDCSRILEYDPLTQAIPWACGNDDAISFKAHDRGMKQRLPNGNTLIVEPDTCRLLEVTLDKQLVWECICPLDAPAPRRSDRSQAITSARRYSRGELRFLRGDIHPRP